MSPVVPFFVCPTNMAGTHPLIFLSVFSIMTAVSRYWVKIMSLARWCVVSSLSMSSRNFPNFGCSIPCSKSVLVFIAAALKWVSAARFLTAFVFPACASAKMRSM